MKRGLCWCTAAFQLGSSTSCDSDAPRASAPTIATTSSPTTKPARTHDAEAQRCLDEIRAFSKLETLSGATSFEARREEILARAKGEPVFFISAPRHPVKLSKTAARYRPLVTGEKARATKLYNNYRAITKTPQLAREVLLTDGYLYSETPAIAFALSYVVRLEDLFDDEVVWLQRGAQLHELRKKAVRGQHYYEHTGERAGERAVILFLDRVSGKREALATPLHRDAEPVRQRMPASRIRVKHWNAEKAVVDLAYGPLLVPALLRSHGAAWGLVCTAQSRAQEPEFSSRLARARQREALISKLRRAIDLQVSEQLPFDEPRTEEGQQDGKLREAWREAYYRGHDRYVFNNDTYRVFDPAGQPSPPQVCIDFIFDTFERAAGSWWQSSEKDRVRSKGRFEIADEEIGSRRRVQDFVDFARRKTAWFESYELPKSERIPLRRRRSFFRQLAMMSEQFLPGDIVIIYGLRDDEKPHYHSFFVYRSDPLSGMPIHLASNAVKPQIRSWEGEMHNAPRRTLRTRIRPRAAWLSEILGHNSVAEPAQK